MKKLLPSILFISLTSLAHAQPGNDLCTGATSVTPNGSCTGGTLTAANDNIGGEVGCATPGNATQHRDVWYSFVATDVNFDYTVTNGTLGGNNVNITLFSGTCGTPVLVNSDCGGSPVAGSFTGALTIGNTYFVAISSNANAQGTFTVCIDNTGPPANDACGGAIAITADSTCIGGTNVGAVDNVGGEVGCATTCAATEHTDVWYSFVATGGDMDYNLVAGTLAGNLEMAIFSTTGACGGLTLVASDCGASPEAGAFPATLIVGNTYYVVISSPSNAQGTFTMCIDNDSQASGGQNCANSMPVCSNSTVSGNSSGFGTQELPNNNTIDGCLTTEHQSSWYVINISTDGTLDLSIDPGANVDYDFAIWSGSSCPPVAAPIRCSYASAANTFAAFGSYATGLGNAQVDASEGTGGNGWVQPMTVVSGEIYILLIDNFTANATPYNLVWNGNAGLACVPLPVEFISFNGAMTENGVLLKWEVGAEINNSHFIVERRNSDGSFTEIGRQEGRGNANSYYMYTFTDARPANGDNYYRITQVDLNGTYTNTQVINVQYNPSGITWSNLYPNPVEEMLNLEIVSISKGELEIEVLDLTGRVQSTTTHETQKGSNTFSLSSQSLAKGAYMVRLKKNGSYVNQSRVFVKN